LVAGAAIAGIFHNQLIAALQRPLLDIGEHMTQTHPTDAINLMVKTSFVFGAIFASPFILYQIWLFISPGMYSHERKYVVPFMSATIFLFGAGAFFGYRWVLPGAIKVLVLDFGKNFNHMITIDDYTGFFLSVIDIVDAKFLLRHFRYAVLAIFLVAAIICPMPDPFSMCLFASPMLALYFIGVGVAYYFDRARKKA